MTKKKKIIISAICVGVLLIGIILGIVLANIKRFSIRHQKEFDFNNHTFMTEITWDAKYTVSGTTYNNGTRVTRTSDNKYGIFSLTENKMLVDVKYKNITPIHSDSDTKKSYFKLTSFELNKLEVIDEKGQNTGILSYNEETDKTLAKIKARDINLTSKKDSVKTKINNRFVDEDIEVKSISYKQPYFQENLYFYEVWEITSTDNIVYENLYQVNEDGHKLIQTINNEIGIELDNTNLTINFLSNGNPVFVNYRNKTFDNKVVSTTAEVYDINFNLKGESTIDQNLLQYATAEFRIGNSILSQFIIPATEEKYTYSETNTLGETYYYLVETYKFSLNNGSFKQITFDYLINDYYDNFNLETVIINASKIEDKTIKNSDNIIINERLQTKNVPYEFNYLTKIKDNRYIASIDGTSNFNLIDNNYNLIAHLENFDSVFATNDAILAKDSGHYYVCNVDGVIIKKYSYQDITYLNDEQYYLRRVTKTNNGLTTSEFYLEQLGLTKDTPLYTYNETDKYKFQDNTYEIFAPYITDYYSLLMGINKVGESYTYSFYTIDGYHLTTITNVGNNAYRPVFVYADNSRVVLYLDSHYFVLDR